MMKSTFAAAALAALVVLPSSADAGNLFCRKQNGIDWCSRWVWDNQLGIGETVAAFPRGCRGDNCDYTVRLQFFEGISEEEERDCRDDPDTPWFECEINDHCVLSAHFSRRIMPLPDWHGSNPETGEPATAAIINTAWLSPPSVRRAITPTWQGHSSFTGKGYQWLGIVLADVQVFDAGRCTVNFAAGYHPDNRGFGSRGLLLPPIQ